MIPVQKRILVLAAGVALLMSACSLKRSTTTGGGGGTGGSGGSGGSGSSGPFTIGGSAVGLQGSGLVLRDNGGDDLSITGTGTVSFTFTTALLAAANYAVTIKTQPSNPSQTCSVINGTGTIVGSVNNVQVSCSQSKFPIGGTVVGLVVGTGDTLELQDNAGDNLFVTG